jgi:predicted molibdopterin-dependent oxidoreductase YjgC
MDYPRLENPVGLQWPCVAPDHPGTPILYEKDFPIGKGKFLPAVYEEDLPAAESPWFLITGPTLFHSGSLSLMSPGLARLQAESFVQVHPADARRLGLENHQKVILRSQHGEVTVKASISSGAAPGVLFIPYHFGQGGGNHLTGRDLTITRVQLEKV